MQSQDSTEKGVSTLEIKRLGGQRGLLLRTVCGQSGLSGLLPQGCSAQLGRGVLPATRPTLQKSSGREEEQLPTGPRLALRPLYSRGTPGCFL